MVNPYEYPVEVVDSKREIQKPQELGTPASPSDSSNHSYEMIGALIGFTVTLLLGIGCIARFRSSLPPPTPGTAQDGTGGLLGLVIILASPISAAFGWLAGMWAGSSRGD